MLTSQSFWNSPSLCWIVDIIIVFVRYHHIKACIERCVSPALLPRLNEISFYTGILSSIGVSLVGNFQVNFKNFMEKCNLKILEILKALEHFQETNVVVVHFIGAFLGFGSLLLYCCFQTYISHKFKTVLYSTQRIFYFRIVLLSLGVVFGLFCKRNLYGCFSVMSRITEIICSF